MKPAVSDTVATLVTGQSKHTQPRKKLFRQHVDDAGTQQDTAVKIADAGIRELITFAAGSLNGKTRIDRAFCIAARSDAGVAKASVTTVSGLALGVVCTFFLNSHTDIDDRLRACTVQQLSAPLSAPPGSAQSEGVRLLPAVKLINLAFHINAAGERVVDTRIMRWPKSCQQGESSGGGGYTRGGG